MTDALEAELDTLFRLPPGEMVEARNVLADRLRKSGDKAQAQRIKGLKRPAAAAWALNQVHFRQPELLDRALAQAARMREMHAQDSVDPRELWALASAQKSATHAVVEAALAHCEAAGLPHAQGQQRKILATVQGWLSGVGQEPPGRMTTELESGGFDAVQEVGARALAVPVERPELPREGSRETKGAPAPSEDEGAIERAQAGVRVAEAALQAAREQTLARSEEFDGAKEELAKTKAELQEAERALSALRFQLKQCNDSVVRTREAHDRAQIVERSAESACARSRELLEKLERQRS